MPPMNNERKTPLTGLILAGGRARRMGGLDKGLLELAGEPLIAHCIRALAPQVDRLFISANRNLDRYEQFGFPVLRDATDDFAGPLAGLLQALQASPDAPVLLAPCDGPLLPAQLAQRLRQAYQAKTDLAVIPHDGTRLQTLCALYSPVALESLKQYLASGQHRVETWSSSLPHRVVDFSEQAECFLNINTEDELRRAAAVLEGQRTC